jgi:hypothetical protein
MKILSQLSPVLVCILLASSSMGAVGIAGEAPSEAELFESGVLPVFASSFERDLFNLRKGLYISGLSNDGFGDYASPYKGHTQVILSAENAPWAGNYFPMKRGGLAFRWKAQRSVTESELPSRERLLAMSAAEVQQLSPVEKYDIYKGDYGFSATRHELHRRGPLRPLRVEDWEGFCNGVRCAGIHLPEPRVSVRMKNPDGVVVVFEPADLKALAGASYFFVEKYSQMGQSTPVGQKAAAQPNPAVFDMALRYFLGEKKKSFVIDTHLGSEIWNESLIGFSRDLQTPQALTEQEKQKYPAATAKVQIKLKLLLLGEIKIEDSNVETKHSVALGKLHDEMKVGYLLYLDSQGRALDGVWDENRSLRGVDFVWFSGGVGTDAKNSLGNGNSNLAFEEIKKLVKKSNTLPLCRLAL